MSEDWSAAQHTVLVVDDNQNNRDLIGRRLERAGYRVLQAENGPEGLDAVQRGGIDLVILDVMMPGLSGIDVLQILRKRHSAAELPVIMATAKDQSEDMVEALRGGANDYVTKPLDFPVVLARVEAQLRTRAASKGQATQRGTVLTAVGPGSVLAGKYRLEEELGSGSFGAVYSATHLGFDQQVAVKVLQTPVDESSETLARFRQEGRSAFRLQHPNVVQVLDFNFSEGSFAFLVMELLRGHNLEQELKSRGHLSAERCGEILLPICDALTEAHAMGIIHRDIKPANIYLHQSRRGEVVKVLDFGIAKLVGDAAMEQHLTLDDGILGTPAYMAPERLSGGEYDGRSDVYALGVVLYQMLAGRPPFVSDTNEAMAVAMMHLTHQVEPLRALRPDISPALESVVLAALEKDPKSRPTAVDLSRNLNEALMDDTIVLPEVRRAARETATNDHTTTVTAPLSVDDNPRPALPMPAEDFELPQLLAAGSAGASPTAEPLPVFAPRELGESWRISPKGSE